jgi:hypothetical protein
VGTNMRCSGRRGTTRCMHLERPRILACPPSTTTTVNVPLKNVSV